MNKKARVIIIIAIILGAILISVMANLIISLTQKSSYPKKYEEYVEEYSSLYNVPEYVVYAIINTESGFDPDAKSSDGAIGLMQMLPSTFKFLASESQLDEEVSTNDLYNPEIAIRYGVYYLRYLFNRFQRWETVYAAYNAGEGRVADWLLYPEYSKDGEKLDKIPIKETASYVKKVNRAVSYYKNTYYKNGVSVK